MVRIVFSSQFKRVGKTLDSQLKTKLQKVIQKIIDNPQSDKPLKYMRGERSVRLKPFRIIYSYREDQDILYLLKLAHRKDVYD